MTGAEQRELRDEYRQPGMEPSRFVEPHPADLKGWIVGLTRRGKGGSARVVEREPAGMTSAASRREIWTAEGGMSTSGST